MSHITKWPLNYSNKSLECKFWLAMAWIKESMLKYADESLLLKNTYVDNRSLYCNHLWLLATCWEAAFDWLTDCIMKGWIIHTWNIELRGMNYWTWKPGRRNSHFFSRSHDGRGLMPLPWLLDVSAAPCFRQCAGPFRGQGPKPKTPLRSCFDAGC